MVITASSSDRPRLVEVGDISDHPDAPRRMSDSTAASRPALLRITW
jgi:hypothetical protein